MLAITNGLSRDFCVELTGTYSSKRGLMRVANKAVRDRCEVMGIECPRQPRFNLYRGYCYDRYRSYSRVRFEGDDVLFEDMDMYEIHGTDMSEVDIALYLASHGPGMYRVLRSPYEPSDTRVGYSCDIRLTFWDGEDPASKAASVASATDTDGTLTHVLALQFVTDEFVWDEGYRKATPRVECSLHDGKWYSDRYWQRNHFTCLYCDTEYEGSGYRTTWAYDPATDSQTARYCCPECYGDGSDFVFEEVYRRTMYRPSLPKGYLTEVKGHTVVASRAASVEICDVCGNVTDMPYHQGLKTYCRTCGRPHDLHGYGHTHPGPGDFRSVSDADAELNLYLGIELETKDAILCAPRDWASVAKDVAELDTTDRDFVECKEDCSIGSSGVEIVSMPATPLWHLRTDYWPDLLTFAGDRAVSNGEKGECGLHIHINNEFFHSSHRFGDEQVTVDRLVNRFADEWKLFSRRDDVEDDRDHYEYCQFLTDDDLGLFPEDCARRKHKATKERIGAESRYHAVNHKRESTTELRFFRSTVDYDELRAAVEAAAGLAIVARSLNKSGFLMENWSWSDMRFELTCALKANNIPYEDFNNYCDKRGL